MDERAKALPHVGGLDTREFQSISQFRRAAALGAMLHPPSTAPRGRQRPRGTMERSGWAATVAVHAPAADRPARLVRRLTLHG